MKVSDFVDYWDSVVKSGYDYSSNSCLYLKDWHFVRDFPDYEAYTTPSFFASDWLNEFWTQRTDVNDDYRFVYMGPKGSWTPLHADVYGSYSWSANVCGRKLWYLLPPGDEEFLKDKLGILAYDVTSSDLRDPAKYPNASRIIGDDGKIGITVVQEPGEVIFVPSGWHHQVYNLEDTISINHNWFNGCNVDIIWRNLWHALGEVQKEIFEFSGSDGWFEHCEVMLRAHHGLNVSEFCWQLESIARKRIELVERDEIDSSFPKWHVIFDLAQILCTYREVMTKAEHVLGAVGFNTDVIVGIISVLNGRSLVDIEWLFR